MLNEVRNELEQTKIALAESKQNENRMVAELKDATSNDTGAHSLRKALTETQQELIDSRRYADELSSKLSEKEKDLALVLKKFSLDERTKKLKKSKEMSHSYPNHQVKSGLSKLLERSPIVQQKSPKEDITEVEERQLNVDINARVSANLKLKDRMDELDAELQNRDDKLRLKEEMLCRLSEENKLFRDQIYDLRHQLHYQEQFREMTKSQHKTEAMLKKLYKERHQHAAQMLALESRMTQIMDQNRALITNQQIEKRTLLRQDEEELNSSSESGNDTANIARDSEHSESEEIIKPDGRFSDIFLHQLESIDSTNKTVN